MMLTAFGHYRHGFLPDAGGWGDQAATYTEAMRFLDNCVARCERAKMDV
jgi:hypothetical protein